MLCLFRLKSDSLFFSTCCEKVRKDHSSQRFYKIAMRPIRHSTDSKIRCHFFTCIAALALLRIIEIKLRRAGVDITAKKAMRHMQRLHSCLTWFPKKNKAQRILEEPDELQEQILEAFGWKNKSEVLQNI